MRRLLDWYHSRPWRRRQAEFKRTNTRYYGDGGTIHQTTYLDVEIYNGRVVAVWFRCQPLPYQVSYVDRERASEMDIMAVNNPAPELHGVEVRDDARYRS